MRSAKHARSSTKSTEKLGRDLGTDSPTYALSRPQRSRPRNSAETRRWSTCSSGRALLNEVDRETRPRLGHVHPFARILGSSTKSTEKLGRDAINPGPVPLLHVSSTKSTEKLGRDTYSSARSIMRPASSTKSTEKLGRDPEEPPASPPSPNPQRSRPRNSAETSGARAGVIINVIPQRSRPRNSAETLLPQTRCERDIESSTKSTEKLGRDLSRDTAPGSPRAPSSTKSTEKLGRDTCLVGVNCGLPCPQRSRPRNSAETPLVTKGAPQSRASSTKSTEKLGRDHQRQPRA